VGWGGHNKIKQAIFEFIRKELGLGWGHLFKNLKKRTLLFSIADRLCFAILYSRPKSATNEHYFSIDNELEYEK
jgi:hypothetical protein